MTLTTPHAVMLGVEKEKEIIKFTSKLDAFDHTFTAWFRGKRPMFSTTSADMQWFSGSKHPLTKTSFLPSLVAQTFPSLSISSCTPFPMCSRTFFVSWSRSGLASAPKPSLYYKGIIMPFRPISK